MNTIGRAEHQTAGEGGGAGDTEVVAPVPPRQKCFFSGDVTGDISGYILPTLIVKFIM